MQADIITTWTESFVIVRPSSINGQVWLTDNLYRDVDAPDDGSIPVDHRYIADIVYAALADGLAVQDSESGRFALEG